MERMGPEDDVYRQIQYYPVWIYLMLAALLVMFIVVAIVVDVAGSAAATVGMIFGVVVVVGALIFFWRLTFIITPTRVDFGFVRPFRKSFRLASIESCEPYELKFSNYGGYGWRWGLDGTSALNTRSGPGIKIVSGEAKRPYVVAVEEPERVCEMLLATSKPLHP